MFPQDHHSRTRFPARHPHLPNDNVAGRTPQMTARAPALPGCQPHPAP